MKHIKESLFGSVDKVKEINACTHEYESCVGVIFDFIEVKSKCKKCGTYNYNSFDVTSS